MNQRFTRKSTNFAKRRRHRLNFAVWDDGGEREGKDRRKETSLIPIPTTTYYFTVLKVFYEHVDDHCEQFVSFCLRQSERESDKLTHTVLNKAVSTVQFGFF